MWAASYTKNLQCLDLNALYLKYFHKRSARPRKTGPLARKRESIAVTGRFVPYIGAIHDRNETYSVYASYTDLFRPQRSYNHDRETNCARTTSWASRQILRRTPERQRGLF